MHGDRAVNEAVNDEAANQAMAGRGDGHVLRNDRTVRFVHWAVALSTFTLVLSGLFQLPIAKRYFVDTLPGLGWSADFAVSLVVHYVAAAVLVFSATLHLAHHGLRGDRGIVPRRGDLRESVQIVKAMAGLGEEPPSHKYLAEQRLAWAFIAASLGLVIVSGLVKVAKNLPFVELPAGVVNASTHLHNLGMILVLLGIVGHLAAFLVPANRALLPSMFTGRVRADYVRHRHGLWAEDLRREGSLADPSAPHPSTGASPPGGEPREAA
jgi:cytochrome b subunit of formate dehydrogenase